jgi:hypothetical protein
MLEDQLYGAAVCGPDWKITSHSVAIVGMFTIINPWRTFLIIARNIVAATGGVRIVRGEARRQPEERAAC